jgi:hypothetical protein
VAHPSILPLGGPPEQELRSSPSIIAGLRPPLVCVCEIFVPATSIGRFAAINGEPRNASLKGRSPWPGSLAIAVPSAAVTYFYSIWAQRLSGLADEIAVAVNAAHLGLLVELAWP